MGKKGNVTRRNFLKCTAAGTIGAGLGLDGMLFAPDKVLAEEMGARGLIEKISQCPYCGVGCGTVIKADPKTGKIVGVVPDKQHPTNRGVQCIKGLNADEPTYVDRLTKVLIRKDMSDPEKGYESQTKGSFDDDVWREATYEEAEKLVSEKAGAIVKKYGGNSVGLYGSGQLTVEAQWMENKLVKGILQSNSIEANARMCMTSAVTAYFATLGSDTPPLCYDDIEMSDMITFWGHNPRESHPIVFWRAADHKKKNGIPTLVSDPRRTGTVQALESVNPRNSHHFASINGDISCLNAIAHCLVTEHEQVIDYKFLKENVTGWQEYIATVKKDYAPEKVKDRTMVEPALIRKIASEWAAATMKGRRRGTGGVISFWGIGYNQHIHGQHNVISIINLHALTGNIGRPGAGPFSMTGQPNAMGERLMGGLTGRLPFNEALANQKHREWMNESWNLPKGRLDKTAGEKNPGMMIGLFERAMKGDVKMMFYMYTTHVHQPDLNTLIRPALKKLFVVTQDIYRHAPNLLYSDVVFPAMTWGEWQGGTYISSERRFDICDGVGKTADGIEGCLPDLDMAIDKGKNIAKLLGLDGEKIFPYKKRKFHPTGTELYDAEEVFEEIVKASKGTDCDLTGMLEVRKKDGTGLYDQIRMHRGIQWPAPNYEIAKAGGTKRRYMGQEEGWTKKPYGAFRHSDGKLHIKTCKQDYSRRKAMSKELNKFGTQKGFYTIDHMDILKKARDMALTPELPDFEYKGRKWDKVPKNKYPFWLGLGIVYEHFHTAKTIRGATTRRLVPEQYVEMHPEDAKENGLHDGDKIRVTTRRGSYEGRVSVGGIRSKVKPARTEVPKGYIFSPWNLSVADSADPKKNKWLVNAVSHRAYDPVSGQADFKKLAARIEKI